MMVAGEQRRSLASGKVLFSLSSETHSQKSNRKQDGGGKQRGGGHRYEPEGDGVVLLFVLIKHRVQQRHSAVIIRSQQGYPRKCSSKCTPYKLGPGEIKGFELMAGGWFSTGTPVVSLGTISISSKLKEAVVRNAGWGHYGRTDASKRLTSLKAGAETSVSE